MNGPVRILSSGYDSGYTIELEDHCWLIKHNGKPMIWVFKELLEELNKLGEPK